MKKTNIYFEDFTTKEQRLGRQEKTSVWEYVGGVLVLVMMFVIWYQFKKLGM